MKSEENTELLNELLNYSHDMIFVIRMDDGYIEYVNQTAIDKFGYSHKEMNEIGIEKFRRPLKENETFADHIKDLKEQGIATDYAYIIKKDGSEFPIEVNAKFIKKDGIDYNIAVVRDITDRLEAEKSLEDMNKNLESLVRQRTSELQKNIAFLRSYKRAMDESSIVTKSDLKGNITYANDKFCEVTGYTISEVIGKPHNIIRHPDTKSEVFKELWDTIKAKKIWKGIIKNKKKNGGYYWVDTNILPIIDEKGEIFEYMAIRHDITELIDQRESLQKIATTDSLTGLGNRYKLISDIETLSNPSIAILNIDRFSEINDFYGHTFGDELIKKVGQSIQKLIQDHGSKQLYRLHSDEFAILNISLRKAEFVKNIDRMIKKIEDTTYTIDDEEVMVQITSSISFEKDDLFITADMAMKSAKKKRINLLVYNESLDINKEYENNIKWTNKLRHAIDNDNLVPFYQAIVNNKTQRWEKYESLVRMIDDGKVISPFFFLDIAKRTKHYETLTKTVIKKSFDTFKDSDKEFSINLTIKDILNLDIQAYIYDLLSKYEIGAQVVFEIVESEGIEKYDEVVKFINNIKKYGCKIAIDDFGTGYSNFNYLLELKADYIKIDGSLIKNIDTDKSAKVLVKTIVSFAKELNIFTIAEYVENETIFNIVKEIGIDYSQGYYFSAPKEIPEFEK